VRSLPEHSPEATAIDRYRAAYEAIIRDQRYLANLDWGKPRAGHPEGTVRAHVAQLEHNLDALRPRLSEEEYWKLRLLVHVHDTFKLDADRNAPIKSPRSHASLAAAFLREFLPEDEDLATIVQYHDEPYAIFLRFKKQGVMDLKRLEALISRVEDLDLFGAFQLIDNATPGKSRESLLFFFSAIPRRAEARFGVEDVQLFE